VITRLNGMHVRTKGRGRIREVNAELGKTILGGDGVGGHDENSVQLPAAEMSAAIDV
jgi:hypothetical protein